MNADESEAVVEASGLERPAARRGVAGVPASARPEFLLTLPHVHGTSGFFVARCRTIARMSWRDWVRNAEVEPSLYAADFAHLGEQLDVLLRRRRAASSTSTSATATSSSR